MTSFSGFQELAEEFEDAADALEDAAGDDVEEAIESGVETTARSVHRSAVRFVPVDEGDLRDSIQLRALVGRPLARQIVVTEEYAHAVEYGRGLVVITPKGDYPLRFTIDGETIVTNRVEQEPREAQPYLRPALNKNRSTLEREIKQELRRTLRQAFRNR